MSDDSTLPPKHVPGEALINALFARAREQGQSLGEMAKELGVSHGYLSLLRSGARQIPNINDEFSAACAKYLAMPRIYVLLLAEKLRSDDFYGATDTGMSKALNNALRMVADGEDAGRAGVSLRDLSELPPAVQYLLVLLFQGAQGLQLLPKQFNLAEVKALDVSESRRNSAA